MGKRWITIDCILPVLEMMDGASPALIFGRRLSLVSMADHWAVHSEEDTHTASSTFHILSGSLSCSFVPISSDHVPKFEHHYLS